MAQTLTSRRTSLVGKGKQVVMIPIEDIRTNPYQPRRFFSHDNIFELAQSIAQVGLIQPISVRKTKDYFELIAGERRLRACAMLGWKCIEAIIVSAYEADSAMIAMIENIQRENLHFLEEAEGYLAIIRGMNISQEELARKIGKNQCTIANKIRILKLPVSVKRLVLSKGLVERQARALIRLHDEKLQLEVIDEIVNKRLNVRETEDLVERIISRTYNAPEVRQQEKPSKKITALVGDTRLYVNSLKDIIKRMSSAGFAPEYHAVEGENELEIRIVIPYGKVR